MAVSRIGPASTRMPGALPRQPSALTPDEQTADDRTILSHLVEQGARVVHLQFFVWKVSHISSVDQTFQCRFNLRASYSEDKSKLQHSQELPQWTGECFPFKPQLRFTSMLHEESEREEWWRVTGADFNKDVQPGALDAVASDRVWVHHNLRIFGLFEETFELRNFPLDLQSLHISVTSSWDASALVLRFSEVQRSSVSANATTSQLFEMRRPQLLAYDSEAWVGGRNLALLSRPEESRTGVRYCRAHIALTLKRHASYYVWNIVTMQMLIGLANFATFVIEPTDVADRLATIITLILASAAFKFVTTSMLPETPYVTIIDELNYFVILQQAVILVLVCVFAKAGLTSASTDNMLALVMLCIFGAFICAYSARFLRAHSQRESLLRGIDAAYEWYFAVERITSIVSA